VTEQQRVLHTTTKHVLMWRLQERFFIGTVADTIHTIQKIIVYWYRLLQPTSKINFKK
jgi:hypothetical protein